MGRKQTKANLRRYGGSEPIRKTTNRRSTSRWHPNHLPQGLLKPTEKQLNYLYMLREKTGSTKTFTPDNQLETSDEIELLKQRLNKNTIR